jgi:hypothetical protein
MPQLPTLNDVTGLVGQGLVNANELTKMTQRLGVEETNYASTDINFPLNVGTEQCAHHIKIKAYTGGSSGTGGFNPPQNTVMNARIFIPDATGGGAMPLIFEHQHNFTDIRLTNIINDSLLGVVATLATKRMLNPAVQILYRSTNLRQFDFGFLMTPKNEAEARQIEQFQRLLRAYAAPESTQSVLISPAEFTFEFYRGDQINPHIPKIGRSVITRVTVNQGPAGSFTAFKDGQPQATLVQFSATEVEFIDRTKVMQGY